jgi:hypothetical protein
MRADRLLAELLILQALGQVCSIRVGEPTRTSAPSP